MNLEIIDSPKKRTISKNRFSKSLLLSGDFPYVELSKIAQIESNRKEVYRPVYHIHKWWAQRLGSVFRGILLSLVNESKSKMLTEFYKSTTFPNLTVFDPFMGSGTTIGEAIKLGMNAVGRDINPVAYNFVRIASNSFPRDEVLEQFNKLENKIGEKILNLYEARDSQGKQATALYYFWVKEIQCPNCSEMVHCFTSKIFAKHAYPKKYPTARSICTSCWNVNQTRYDATNVKCEKCKENYNPQEAASAGAKISCVECSHEFPIGESIRNEQGPPKHKMYAKLILRADGQKEYLPATEFDLKTYNKARLQLDKMKNAIPAGKLEDGYNTKQAINYNYKEWHQFFNERQLLIANLIKIEIEKLECDEEIKELFKLFLSGVLEFNNMFASYKGEGTGAVRHMFSHHVLKPEKTPLEANFWGTKKSSGSFSNLFKSRVLRAIDYKNNPFEPGVDEKIYLPNKIPSVKIFDIFEKYAESNGQKVLLTCGDSGQTNLPNKSIDVIVTDPPFFDNVNYSELADFFFIWHKHFGLSKNQQLSTRSLNEVQHQDSNTFSSRFEAVLKECHRVLNEDGVLTFSYHHSKEEGWTSIAKALWNSEFRVVKTYPIVAEMANATPKAAAKEPITLDIIIVCQASHSLIPNDADLNFVDLAQNQISKMSKEFYLSKNDRKIILKGAALIRASQKKSLNEKMDDFENSVKVIEKILR